MENSWLVSNIGEKVVNRYSYYKSDRLPKYLNSQIIQPYLYSISDELINPVNVGGWFLK